MKYWLEKFDWEKQEKLINRFSHYRAGDVEKRFTKDELLTNIMIYRATETINSAFLNYYEPAHNQSADFSDKNRVEVPTAFARFPKDLTPAPREWTTRFFASIERWTEMPAGGHFAALEEPERMVEDIHAFFRPLQRDSRRSR